MQLFKELDQILKTPTLFPPQEERGWGQARPLQQPAVFGFYGQIVDACIPLCHIT